MNHQSEEYYDLPLEMAAEDTDPSIIPDPDSLPVEDDLIDEDEDEEEELEDEDEDDDELDTSREDSLDIENEEDDDDVVI